MKKKICHMLSYFIVIIPVVLILMPLWMMVVGTFMGKGEIIHKIGVVFEEGEQPISWSIVPDFPTLKAYLELFLDSPKFFVMFWNSVSQVLPVLLGQLILGIPAAWGFARYDSKGKRRLFSLYIILMIMPFQVTMVSNYIVLDYIHSLNTHLAIILPGIFSTFPIFIMTKFFKSIPEEMLESARIDGANRWVLLNRIGIPLGKGGIVSMVILSFLEYWNALEQPLTFLRDKAYWPLSLYLPEITSENIGVAFVASAIMMTPSVCVYLRGQTYLEQGIVASGIKQ